MRLRIATAGEKWELGEALANVLICSEIEPLRCRMTCAWFHHSNHLNASRLLQEGLDEMAKAEIKKAVEAYRKAYPQAKSRNGAYASCSRLLRNPGVFAARQWHYAVAAGEVPSEAQPKTESEIWQYLKDFGSWRSQFSPQSGHRYQENRW